MPSLSRYYERTGNEPSQSLKIQIKKEPSENTNLLVHQTVSLEFNKNPFKWSKRIGAILVVTNFFYIVYIVLMIVVATLVLELHSENISVAQQQNYQFPAFNRAIEVSSICSAGMLTLSLSIGIMSTLSGCISVGKQLVLSWAHLVLNFLFSVSLMTLSCYYFLVLADSWMSAFFLSILGTFVAMGVVLALIRVVVLTKEIKALEHEKSLVN